jgi:protein tyrosine/serine phosphatase
VETGDRLVPFDAVFNFRDLGGYETVDGRHVRPRAVFRSGPLQRLTAADLERIRKRGVRTVIDLRSTEELTEWGRFPVTADVEFRHIPLYENDARRSYAQMATTGRGALATALRVIAECDEAIVFHCGSGKDRTGILAALLLSALGVPDDSIGADYQLSELALAPSIAWAEANDPAMAAALANLPAEKRRSAPETITTFLDTLRDRHGSIEAFLAGAGLEPEVLEALRAQLLEP